MKQIVFNFVSPKWPTWRDYITFPACERPGSSFWIRILRNYHQYYSFQQSWLYSRSVRNSSDSAGNATTLQLVRTITTSRDHQQVCPVGHKQSLRQSLAWWAAIQTGPQTNYSSSIFIVPTWWPQTVYYKHFKTICPGSSRGHCGSQKLSCTLGLQCLFPERFHLNPGNLFAKDRKSFFPHIYQLNSMNIASPLLHFKCPQALLNSLL